MSIFKYNCDQSVITSSQKTQQSDRPWEIGAHVVSGGFSSGGQRFLANNMCQTYIPMVTSSWYVLAQNQLPSFAKDASRLFLTFADYILNRAPKKQMMLFPLAHVFSENYGGGAPPNLDRSRFHPFEVGFFGFFFGPLWGHAQQYTQISVPSIAPENLVNLVKSDQTRCKCGMFFFCCWKTFSNKFAFCIAFSPSAFSHDFFFWHVAEWRPARPPLRIVPGDFIKTYQACENIVLDLTGDFWRFSPTRNTSETKAAWKSTQFIEFTMEFTQQFNRKFWIQQFECKLIIKSWQLVNSKLPSKMWCLPTKTRFQHGEPSRLVGRASVALMWRGSEDDVSRIFLEMAVLLTLILY